MVSQRSLLSAPRLLTILLASFSVVSSVSGAAAVDDTDYSSEEDYTVNGITLTEADQAPECLSKCPALEKYGQGTELPKCITEELKDPEYSKYSDMVMSGNYGDDEENYQAITEIMSCICTDVDMIKELADCVFNEPCGNNNTAVYDAISIGYKLCGVMYNVTYPAPTEVVKMLDISVPSGVIVPTTITGVPQATAWPGKTTTASQTSTTASSNPSGIASSSSSSNSSTVTQDTNAAMKSSPSYYLIFFAFIAFLAVSTSAQSNSTTSTITGGVPTTTTTVNGTLTSTSTVSITSGASNITLTTASPTNNRSSTTTSRTTSTSGTSSTTAGSSASASPSSSDVPGNAIRNGASVGLLAAGAVAAAFMF